MEEIKKTLFSLDGKLTFFVCFANDEHPNSALESVVRSGWALKDSLSHLRNYEVS